MQTQLSDVALLRVIKDNSVLEIWLDRSPKTYYAGSVLIGQEGDRDIETINQFIENGYLKGITTDSCCELYNMTEKGVEYLRSFNID